MTLHHALQYYTIQSNLLTLNLTSKQTNIVADATAPASPHSRTHTHTPPLPANSISGGSGARAAPAPRPTSPTAASERGPVSAPFHK